MQIDFITIKSVKLMTTSIYVKEELETPMNNLILLSKNLSSCAVFTFYNCVDCDRIIKALNLMVSKGYDMTECEAEDYIFVAVIIRNLPKGTTIDELIKLCGKDDVICCSDIKKINEWFCAIVQLNQLKIAENLCRLLNFTDFENSLNHKSKIKVNIHPKTNYRERCNYYPFCNYMFDSPAEQQQAKEKSLGYSTPTTQSTSIRASSTDCEMKKEVSPQNYLLKRREQNLYNMPKTPSFGFKDSNYSSDHSVSNFVQKTLHNQLNKYPKDNKHKGKRRDEKANNKRSDKNY